jgi:hypothetical protein
MTQLPPKWLELPSARMRRSYHDSAAADGQPLSPPAQRTAKDFEATATAGPALTFPLSAFSAGHSGSGGGGGGGGQGGARDDRHVVVTPVACQPLAVAGEGKQSPSGGAICFATSREGLSVGAGSQMLNAHVALAAHRAQQSVALTLRQ